MRTREKTWASFSSKPYKTWSQTITVNEKKLRYLKQTTKYHCSPTAFINLVKWAGGKCSNKKDMAFFEKFLSMKGTSKFSGPTSDHFIPMLGMLTTGACFDNTPFLFSVFSHISLKNLIPWLQDKDHAMLLWYEWSRIGVRHGHIMLLTGISPDGETFIGHNMGGHSTSAISRKWMRKHYSRKSIWSYKHQRWGVGRQVAYFISKNNDRTRQEKFELLASEIPVTM